MQLAVGFRARISACRYYALIGLGQTTGWAGGHDYAFFNGQAMIGGFSHILFYIVKEDDTMPKNTPVVRCVFESAERALPELLEESFRLYLHRILAGYGKVTIQ